MHEVLGLPAVLFEGAQTAEGVAKFGRCLDNGNCRRMK